jgi:hypothetical protein
MQISLTSCQDTNKIGNIISKEWKDTAFHIWHSLTDRVNEDDGEDDLETKAILGFMGTGLNGESLQS